MADLTKLLQLDERLRVAAALREAAYLEWPHEYVKDQHGKPVTDRLCEDHRKHVLALIPDSDRSALDAALKKAEHKGFCEALHRVESSIRDPESGGDLLIMQALDAHDAEVRNRALEEAAALSEEKDMDVRKWLYEKTFLDSGNAVVAQAASHALAPAIMKMVEALIDAPLPGSFGSAEEFSQAWIGWYRGTYRAALAELEKP